MAQRKLELQLRMNEARKLNNRAVVEEQERLTEGVAYEKKRAKDELWGEKRAVQASLEAQGLCKEKAKYVFESATGGAIDTSERFPPRSEKVSCHAAAPTSCPSSAPPWRGGAGRRRPSSLRPTAGVSTTLIREWSA